jgi:hypothetical protein
MSKATPKHKQKILKKEKILDTGREEKSLTFMQSLKIIGRQTHRKKREARLIRLPLNINKKYSKRKSTRHREGRKITYIYAVPKHSRNNPEKDDLTKRDSLPFRPERWTPGSVHRLSTQLAQRWRQSPPDVQTFVSDLSRNSGTAATATMKAVGVPRRPPFRYYLSPGPTCC